MFYIVVFCLTSGTLGQFLGGPGSNPCPKGYKLYGSSCYRYVNLLASWTDAWQICQTMSAMLVSIESQQENQYLTDLVKNETATEAVASTPNSLAERIWTSGANFQGDVSWIATRKALSYSSWHRGEPYVSSFKDVFCVMKMGDGWFSDQCKHERKFVCEKELEGLVIPAGNNGEFGRPTSTQKTTFTKQLVDTFG